MTPEQRQSIIAEAETWLRTPWHHNARVRGAGVDCGQLCIAAYVGSGLVPDFQTGTYSPDFMMHKHEERFLAFVTQYLDEVEKPEPGDVAVWKFAKCFAHGAIVVDWPRIIHAHRPERMVVYGDATQGPLARTGKGLFAARREVRFFSIAGRLAP